MFAQNSIALWKENNMKIVDYKYKTYNNKKPLHLNVVFFLHNVTFKWYIQVEIIHDNHNVNPK